MELKHLNSQKKPFSLSTLCLQSRLLVHNCLRWLQRLSFQRSTEVSNGAATSEYRDPRRDPGNIMLMDLTMIPNKLPTVCMNIHVGRGKHKDVQRPGTTLRLGLLDTGASFNLISHHAHAALNLPKQPYHGLVRSIAGYTSLDGSTNVEWHGLSTTHSSTSLTKVHHTSFFILPADEKPMFDCVLGWPWIVQNWDEAERHFMANKLDLSE